MGYFIKNTDDGNFLVDSGDIIGSVIISTNGWEPSIEEVYKSLIKPEYLTINIGANMGYHTIKLASISRKVIAFEPQIKMFNQLCSNIYLNNMNDKIDAHHLALGDKQEKARMSSLEGNPNSVCGDLSNLGGVDIPENGNGEEINISTLDSFDLNPDFILIDVERFEGKVIKGSEITINKNKPTLLIEIWTSDANERFFQLKYLGYEIYGKDPLGANYIALHPEFKDYEEQKEILKSLSFFEYSFSYHKRYI